MIPTWEQMHAEILQQMDESEALGIRRATKSNLAKKFGWATGQNANYYITKKYAAEFENAGLVYVNAGRAGGIYMKDDAEKPQNTPRTKTSDTIDVGSLIDRLDAPVEKKSIETLLAEQIRLQLDRNAQFADRILQIAMAA